MTAREPSPRPVAPRRAHEVACLNSASSVAGADLHTAVVCSVDEVLFIAAATTPEELQERVAEYVRQNAERALFPIDSQRVLALLDRGGWNAAIAEYFACVGRRWDAERLHVRPIRVA